MELKINPQTPFDFDLSARIFSDGDDRIQSYEAGAYRQAVRLNGKPALLTLRSTGSVDRPELILNLAPDEAFSDEDAIKAERLISTIFNLQFDLNRFYQAVAHDRTMARIANLLRGLKGPSTPTAFEALIDSVIEQQISLVAAWSIQRRLILAFGDRLDWNGKTYFIFPRPERLAQATTEQLRRLGLSGRKSEYVHGIAVLVAEGLDLEALKVKDEVEIIEELTGIRGVGVWTAEMTMVRGMQKFDAFPADDLGLRRVISHYYYRDRKITAEEARHTAGFWKGWRGVASFYLIMAEMMGIEPEHDMQR